MEPEPVEIPDDEEEEVVTDDEIDPQLEDPDDQEEDYDSYDYEDNPAIRTTTMETDISILNELEETEDDESFLISGDSLKIHTSPYLTKYEMAKVLSVRAQQINTRAPSTLPSSEFPQGVYPLDGYTVAVMELKKGRLPLIIGRRLPNGTILRIPVHSLLIPDQI
jgi:DNA-directed RNA polymerase subunit K/omega